MKYIKRITNGEMPDSIPVGHIVMNGGAADLKSSGSSQITAFSGEKTYSSFADATELNQVSAIGALLWKKDSDGSLVATNGDSTASDYWDPKSDTVTTPTKAGHTLIAVCVGYGKWAYASWTGLTTTYKWAASNTDDLYKWHPSMVHGHGYENTEHVLTNHADILTGTIWEQIKSVRDTGIPVFLPSKYELLEAQENICDDNHSAKAEGDTSYQACTYTKNIGKLLSGSASSCWSSSQNANNYFTAFNVYFGSSSAYDIPKNYAYRSLVLLHFGA